MVCPGELGAAPCSAGGDCSMESAGLLGASCCSGFLFLLIFTAAVTFLTLDYKEIQSVHPKGNQSWAFIGRTDVEAEAPILWPPDTKN